MCIDHCRMLTQNIFAFIRTKKNDFKFYISRGHVFLVIMKFYLIRLKFVEQRKETESKGGKR